MSLSDGFNTAAAGLEEDRPAPLRKRRASPFSLRLTADERARLIEEAKGAPLGAYIKAKVTGAPLPVRMRRTGLSVEDRQALAQVLALLGRSRLSSNLNQLAYLANVGALPMTPETEAELIDSVRAVRGVRILLMTALGLKPELREDRS
ncbi:hypothetical protein BJF93_07005 [Xaviernesmea oryzae]|uniref:Bacterial mobilisation domain-containing protein n=1 Tax=Xaviernesmea oryzae TaxID=464029 RepID=A0A1Q9ASC1_9HYPH|nr:hypothetical protein [Xaviernesmea oryzae]OLP58342.1 hypothetical protein BJF93_07005 [Xaviernesmea oryzae]SEL41180.1 hypothetical protein SAMN04487976_10813 [Xaviernesmea oryzae]